MEEEKYDHIYECDFSELSSRLYNLPEEYTKNLFIVSGKFDEQFAFTQIRAGLRTMLKPFVVLDFTAVTGITDIPESAFENCNRLKGIKLPKSVESIGGGAFSECYLKFVQLGKHPSKIKITPYDYSKFSKEGLKEFIVLQSCDESDDGKEHLIVVPIVTKTESKSIPSPTVVNNRQNKNTQGERTMENGFRQKYFEYCKLDSSTSIATLNKYGLNGWELVAVTVSGGGTPMGSSVGTNGYILKRELDPVQADKKIAIERQKEKERQEQLDWENGHGRAPWDRNRPPTPTSWVDIGF